MEPEKTFETEVAAYRQPMVTSIGIVLGFLLAFLANWAVEADEAPALSTASDFAVALALLGSVVLFTVALFRLLNNRVYPNAGERYQTTFRVYIVAFLLAFSGLAVALII
jgi:hypothetical protein